MEEARSNSPKHGHRDTGRRSAKTRIDKKCGRLDGNKGAGVRKGPSKEDVLVIRGCYSGRSGGEGALVG